MTWTRLKLGCAERLFLLWGLLTAFAVLGLGAARAQTNISLVLPADIYDLPTIPSTRHQVNMPSGPSDYTYHHNALITWWQGKFFVAWTATPQSEWTDPYEAWVATAVDADTWTAPFKPFAPGHATYKAYLLDRLGAPPSTPVTLRLAPRCWMPTDDRLYLWTLAAGNGASMGRAVYTEDGTTWHEVDPNVLEDYELNQGLGTMRYTWSNHRPIRLSDGRLMAFHLNGQNELFPMTSAANVLTNWSGPSVDIGAAVDVGEPGGWEGPDGVLHGITRDADTYVWHTYSLDGGASWATLTRQDGFRDNPGNKHFGTFPDGSIWYVGGPVPGSRIPLVLGVSRDGWTFDENFIIRGEHIDPIWYSEGKSEDRPGWEYPSAVYHEGYLYVAYSRTRDFIEVSKVDVSGLSVTEPSVTLFTTSPSPTPDTSIVYTATFSDAMTGVLPGLFSTIGTAVSSVDSVVETIPGRVWRVTVAVTGEGTVNLRLLDDDTIQNGAMEPLNGPNVGGDEYVLGNEITVVDLIGNHVIIDLYDDANYNQDGKWNAPLNVQGAGNDILTFDESVTPGRLWVDMDASPGDYSCFVMTRNDVTLPVGEYVRCNVRLISGSADPNPNAGMVLMAGQTASDRSNSLRFALRGDGLVKVNAYGDGGAEYADADLVIPGFALGQDYTLQIERTGETQYTFSYGVGNDVSVAVTTIDHPGAANPSVPAMYLANGLADFTAEFDNFLASAVGPPLLGDEPPTPDTIVDDFLNGILDAGWKAGNYPQYSGLADVVSFDESQTPGILVLDFEDTDGAAQSELVMREDYELVPRSSVQVDVRIAAGAQTPNVWVGLGLATVSSGIDQDRSNTVYYGLRNDGVVRGNFFGAAGAEIGGVEPVLAGYAPGDAVSLAIHRASETLYAVYVALNGGAWSLVGSVDYIAPHTPPNRLGLFLANGLEDYTAEFSDCVGANLAKLTTASHMGAYFE